MGPAVYAVRRWVQLPMEWDNGSSCLCSEMMGPAVYAVRRWVQLPMEWDNGSSCLWNETTGPAAYAVRRWVQLPMEWDNGSSCLWSETTGPAGYGVRQWVQLSMQWDNGSSCLCSETMGPAPYGVRQWVQLSMEWDNGSSCLCSETMGPAVYEVRRWVQRRARTDLLWLALVLTVTFNTSALMTGRHKRQIDHCNYHQRWWTQPTWTDSRKERFKKMYHVPKNVHLFIFCSLQVTWVTNPEVGWQYFPPGQQLPSWPLRGLLPILLLGEQRHDGCKQFA